MWIDIEHLSAYVEKGDGFKAAGNTEQPTEDVDPTSWLFGAASNTKNTDLSDWRRALARKPSLLAAQDSFKLVQAWPGVDMPSLAIAAGALWAISLPGSVVGAGSLMVGGARGEDWTVHTQWTD